MGSTAVLPVRDDEIVVLHLLEEIPHHAVGFWIVSPILILLVEIKRIDLSVVGNNLVQDR